MQKYLVSFVVSLNSCINKFDFLFIFFDTKIFKFCFSPAKVLQDLSPCKAFSGTKKKENAQIKRKK